MSNLVTFQDIRADQQLINSRITFDDDLFVNDDGVDIETDESEKNQKQKDSKRKRNRKKKSTAIAPKSKSETITNGKHSANENGSNKENDDADIEIEFVPEEITLDKNFAEFSRVFEHFKVGVRFFNLFKKVFLIFGRNMKVGWFWSDQN